jgi:hypothetical protein
VACTTTIPYAPEEKIFMISHPIYWNRAMIPTLIIVTFMLVTPVQSEPIEGFRDLKFGMTEKEVSSLEACTSSSECLYELFGKNRYLYPLYRNSGSGSSPSSKPDGQNLPRLVRITIDMGGFTDQFYGELQQMLMDNYRVTLDLTEKEINTFLNEQTSELVLEYENGTVLLKVVRRKFGNLVLKVIYQTDKMAAESRTPRSAPQ